VAVFPQRSRVSQLQGHLRTARLRRCRARRSWTARLRRYRPRRVCNVAAHNVLAAAFLRIAFAALSLDGAPAALPRTAHWRCCHPRRACDVVAHGALATSPHKTSLRRRFCVLPARRRTRTARLQHRRICGVAAHGNLAAAAPDGALAALPRTPRDRLMAVTVLTQQTLALPPALTARQWTAPPFGCGGLAAYYQSGCGGQRDVACSGHCPVFVTVLHFVVGCR
jgi:hypothetical protein